MLNPDTRHLLTDALRPPSGQRLDAAIATTYTLDLATLLLAPLSMAAYDQAEEGIDKAAPHELLEAIRRYAGRTTVFCQAGGIHVPSTYRKLTVFAEESIVEIAPPPGRVFHPKIWVLRFTDDAKNLTHRLVCLSRNMTGDRSWDTVLVTEEEPGAAHEMPAAPAARFLDDLLSMSVRPVPAERSDLVRDMASTLRERSLAVPAPFTAGVLRPAGTPDGGGWPMPASPDRALVVSPFLDVTTVRRLPSEVTIVSRAETFDRLGATTLEGHLLRVLQPHADAPPDDLHSDTGSDAGDQDIDTASALEVKSGLHAKVLAWDEGSTGSVLTGSANATSAAFGGNVEFGVLLSGPVARCGASAILKDDDKTPGFARLLQPHVARQDPVTDAEYELEREVEAFHAALAASGPQFHASALADGYEMRLGWTSACEQVGETWVRPVAVKPAYDRRLGDRNVWRGLGLPDLTPFVAVRTRLERGDVAVERSSALHATLLGAPDDRARRILRELLAKVEDVLRYLALLLKDPGLDDVAGTILEVANDDPDGGQDAPGWGWVEDLVLVEPLVRAFARNDGGLDRVARLLDDLREDDGTLPDLGPDFESLWHVVSAAQGGR